MIDMKAYRQSVQKRREEMAEHLRSQNKPLSKKQGALILRDKFGKLDLSDYMAAWRIAFE